MSRFPRAALGATALSLWTTLAFAQAPAPAALGAEDLVKQAYERNTAAYSNIRANLKMTLTTTKGETKVRDLELRGVRNSAGLVRTIVRFRSPADVAGTAFLVLQNNSGPPDQYLYLPNLKKVRRIAAGQASQSFMGSDFTFLDMSPVPAAGTTDLSYQKMPDAEVGGQAAFVVEIKPRVQGAPYSRVVIYVQKELLIPIKAEFFDAVGAPLKTLLVRKLKKLKAADGPRVVPLETEMRNLQKGSSTVLALEDVDVETKQAEADFTPAALEQ
ncbi:MAG: outer membrane lipoprotein-sorting protein [Deltaproteobacteria bacterium]|nr:outer membrane lipoprotein-sorting protein [Deltaproteobacteria bacterium]